MSRQAAKYAPGAPVAVALPGPGGPFLEAGEVISVFQQEPELRYWVALPLGRTLVFESEIVEGQRYQSIDEAEVGCER